jgi:hypothetical protein
MGRVVNEEDLRLAKIYSVLLVYVFEALVLPDRMISNLEFKLFTRLSCSLSTKPVTTLVPENATPMIHQARRYHLRENSEEHDPLVGTRSLRRATTWEAERRGLLDVKDE